MLLLALLLLLPYDVVVVVAGREPLLSRDAPVPMGAFRLVLVLCVTTSTRRAGAAASAARSPGDTSVDGGTVASAPLPDDVR